MGFRNDRTVGITVVAYITVSPRIDVLLPFLQQLLSVLCRVLLLKRVMNIKKRRGICLETSVCDYVMDVSGYWRGQLQSQAPDG
jgi:hypothetical protein